MGWACHGDSAGVEASSGEEGAQVRLCWLRAACLDANGNQATFTSTLVVSRTGSSKDLERRIHAVQQPLEPA